MVEIEIGVLRGQCLDRRIGDREVLNTEVAAWQRHRNASGARVKWKFTTERARSKLARASHVRRFKLQAQKFLARPSSCSAWPPLSKAGGTIM
jgi:hypothetical protein